MVSLLRIIVPEPAYASVLLTYIVVSDGSTDLTRPVKNILDELNACLALVLRLRLTSFVNIIFV